MRCPCKRALSQRLLDHSMLQHRDGPTTAWLERRGVAVIGSALRARVFDVVCQCKLFPSLDLHLMLRRCAEKPACSFRTHASGARACRVQGVWCGVWAAGRRAQEEVGKAQQVSCFARNLLVHRTSLSDYRALPRPHSLSLSVALSLSLSLFLSLSSCQLSIRC